MTIEELSEMTNEEITLNEVIEHILDSRRNVLKRLIARIDEKKVWRQSEVKNAILELLIQDEGPKQ